MHRIGPSPPAPGPCRRRATADRDAPNSVRKTRRCPSAWRNWSRSARPPAQRRSSRHALRRTGHRHSRDRSRNCPGRAHPGMCRTRHGTFAAPAAGRLQSVLGSWRSFLPPRWMSACGIALCRTRRPVSDPRVFPLVTHHHARANHASDCSPGSTVHAASIRWSRLYSLDKPGSGQTENGRDHPRCTAPLNPMRPAPCSQSPRPVAPPSPLR